MKSEFDTFIEVLEASNKKYGKDKPLTLGHVLNIAKLAKKVHTKLEDDEYQLLDKIESELWEDMHRYGSN